MLGFSRFFGSSHKKAMLAWNNGAPTAESPQEANLVWAPYLEEWRKGIERDFMGMLTQHRGAERVGWINDSKFLASFWKNAQVGHLAGFLPAHEQRQRMRPYVEGAAVAGNQAFFDSMPWYKVGTLVGDILGNTHAIVHPTILSWYQTKTEDDLLPTSLRESRPILCQKNIFKQLAWYSSNPSCVWIGRGSSFLQAIDDVCYALMWRSELANQDIIRVLGHLMTHVVPQGQANDAIARIEHRLGAHEHRDLALIAMCSGHDVDGSVVSKAVASMARDLQRAKPVESLAQGRGPGWEALSLLTDVERIVFPVHLYQTVLALGFHRTPAVESMEVDSNLFSPVQP